MSYRPGELVRLKDGDGHLIDYQDTGWTQRQRRFLNKINEAIGSLRISLDAPDMVHDGPVIRCGGDHVLYPVMTTLYRIFNGGSWRLGGRFYGGWWQQARPDDRKLLQIDGELVVEHDYSQLHPRLIYALAGKRLDGDAYTLPGWDRNDAKPAFNILINAPNYQSALGAIARHLHGDKRQAAVLINDLRNRHAAIAMHFHTGVGIKLQNADAGMARSIMARLLRRGIATLPVHDSFIVQRRHEGSLLEAMEAAEHAVGLVPAFHAISTSSSQSVPHMEGAPRGAVGVPSGVPVVVSGLAVGVLLPLFPSLPSSARSGRPLLEKRVSVPVGRRQLDLFALPMPSLADATLTDWTRRGGLIPSPMAAAVAAVRRERGHTFQAMASVIRLSRPQTSNIARGRFGTTPEHAARLAAYIRGDDVAA